MSKVTVVLNTREVREQLLKSKTISDFIEKKAEEIANRAGDGYAHDTYIGKNRVNSMVFAETQEAIQDNLENNTLIKSVK